MRLMLIGGTHPRHLHYFNTIADNFEVSGILSEVRGGMMPEAPKYISNRDRALWRRHFTNRQMAEVEFFGDGRSNPALLAGKSVSNYTVASAEYLNTEESADFVQEINPDLVLIFGCHMIRDPLFSVLPLNSINLHLGLSPRYRGSATLFWPFYFLEPQFAGCAFHRIVSEPDAGDILHQCRPVLEKGDKIHEVAAKAVIKATEDMVQMLERYPDWEFYQQKNTGKCFLTTDFQPAHLRMIYETYDDNIVDAYLTGNLRQHQPKLYEQPNV